MGLDSMVLLACCIPTMVLERKHCCLPFRREDTNFFIEASLVVITSTLVPLSTLTA